MKTTVAIKGAEFHAFHGYYEEERKTGNTFIIDAEVELKTFDSNDDNIGDTVNYEKLFKICDSEMGKTQKLLETVVFNIITRFKAEFSNVTGGKVKMEKLGPQLGGKVAKAVVEMEF
ncbi:MAG: dihydroneopterin aldolase [Saprospiraceae bacterium]|jgi:dihydroneopterin aldolase